MMKNETLEFQEYLLALPEWDNVDHIKEYFNQLNIEFPGGLVNEVFFKAFAAWFVMLVESLIDKEVRHNNINNVGLLLSGPQGIGKTKFIKGLLPQQFQIKFYVNSDPDSVFYAGYLAKKIIINIDEIATGSTKHIRQIEEKLEVESLPLRIPYAREASHYKRCASIAAETCAYNLFKGDPEKWIVLMVNRISFNDKIDIDQMYAQALFNINFSTFKSGDKTWTIK